MGVKALTFSGGGEPLLYQHLPATLEALSYSPVKVAAITNGALLRGEIAELFANHGSWVRVSMDGWDDASYKEYRGVADYSKIMANMEAFVKLGGSCKLGVVINVSKENASHLYDMTKSLKDIGVQSVKFAPCVVDDDQMKNNTYHAPVSTVAIPWIADCEQNLADDSFQVVNGYHTQLESFDKSYKWCPMSQIRCVIGADCNVYTCQDKAYTTDGLLGSIKDRSFKEFWMNNKHRFYMIHPHKNCNHHCVANELNKTIHSYLDVDKEHLEFV
jgi:sulfatase maturation enzyme AslB (radical SAM superfamily)